MNVTFEKNGLLKNVPYGFSWTNLFFIFLVPLIRGDLKWAIIMMLAVPFSGGLSILVFPFFYNKLYIKDLLANGWKPGTDIDRKFLIEKNILSK